MMPLLVVYADFLGIVGGGIVATASLGLTWVQYTQEIERAITLTTFSIGIVKSVVFGVLVAMCGCLAGLRAGRSAAAVGEAATRAMVTAIVWIIVSDGLFAVVFYLARGLRAMAAKRTSPSAWSISPWPTAAPS